MGSACHSGPVMIVSTEVQFSGAISGSFQRVPISIPGRYMLEDRSEHRCLVTAMSPGDVVLSAGRPGNPGEQVIAYLEFIGRVEGVVLSLLPEGFVMTVSASERKRDKLTAQLTWLANRHELDLPDGRRHERFSPVRSEATLVTRDGGRYSCHIIDISVSGAALRCDVMLDIGTEVSVASIPGRVTRHLPEGIAVQFDTLQDEAYILSKFIA